MSLKIKPLKKLGKAKIEVERGAWKFERWLNKEKTAQDMAAIEYKKAHPDRYFVAFIKLDMPRSSAPEHVWPSVINETLLFEQPDMPSLDDVIATAKKAWLIAQRIEVLNFYEMNTKDYFKFLGNESEWRVIEE